MRKYTRQTGSFEAKDPAGKSYTVNIFTVFEEIPTRGGTDQVPVSAILKTADGTSVSKNGVGEYEIAQTGTKLRSSDPSAP